MVNTRVVDRRYDWRMSEQPPSGPSYGQSASGFPAASPATGPYPPPQWPTPTSGPSRWPTFAALAIALLATALAIVGWFRPAPTPTQTHSATPSWSAQQVSDAKARACNAADTVHKGAMLHSGTGTQQSSDPAMAEAQAADGRLAVIAGGWYLRDHLSPATPPVLTDAMQHLSQVMLELGANYLAGAKNADPSQAALIEEGNTAFERVQDLCK